ncbi:MAG: L-threonylcarbamoyladenylate synthase [Chloroflexaceae bacterium]|nr:L-threonylcarbamoyladenylate synthase [Chloroflexaceae bacterium]
MQTQTAPQSAKLIPEIVQRLAAGEVLVLPMATVYAIAAQAFNPNAVAELARVKEWPVPHPLALLTSPDKAAEFGVINSPCQQLLAHLPLPITFLVPPRPNVPQFILQGRKSLMLVCPDEFILQLVQTAPFAIAVTPAKQPPDAIARNFTTAKQLFAGKVPLIVDGGQCRYGQNGTMVDFTVDIPTVLSYGPISSDNLKQLLPEVELPSHLRK